MQALRTLSLLLVWLLVPASLSASPHPLATLNDNFAELDQRITQQHTAWKAPYQHAITLTHSTEPQQALPVFESLLETLAEQEIPFSRVYARYFTLAEQLNERPRTARFLLDLSSRHPTPWVKGALQETRARVNGRALSEAFLARLEARRDQTGLAADLGTLYNVIWPHGFVGAAQYKAELAETLIQSMGTGFDGSGIERLANWRYRRETDPVPPEPGMWQTALEQALPTKQRPAIIGAFSQYLAALVASNRLEDGARWARARQMTGDNSPELSMIVDLLETAHASHSQFESALSTVSGLRNSAPRQLASRAD